MIDDRLRYWARFLLGAAILFWQLKHGVQFWLLLVIVWLLGGPLEQMISLFTSGRIQINVKSDDPPASPSPPPPLSPPPPPPVDEPPAPADASEKPSES